MDAFRRYQKLQRLAQDKGATKHERLAARKQMSAMRRKGILKTGTRPREVSAKMRLRRAL